jgi:hypothetical protein
VRTACVSLVSKAILWHLKAEPVVASFPDMISGITATMSVDTTNITALQEALSSFRLLNEKLSLFAATIFKPYRPELFAALLNLLLARNFDLLREEIVDTLYRLAASNFEEFYTIVWTRTSLSLSLSLSLSMHSITHFSMVLLLSSYCHNSCITQAYHKLSNSYCSHNLEAIPICHRLLPRSTSWSTTIGLSPRKASTTRRRLAGFQCQYK